MFLLDCEQDVLFIDKECGDDQKAIGVQSVGINVNKVLDNVFIIELSAVQFPHKEAPVYAAIWIYEPDFSTEFDQPKNIWTMI